MSAAPAAAPGSPAAPLPVAAAAALTSAMGEVTLGPAAASPTVGAAALGPAASSYAAELWGDVPRAQRPEWAAVLAEARALSEGAPQQVQALTDDVAKALLRGRGGAAASNAGRVRASRFPVFLSSTFDGEPRPFSGFHKHILQLVSPSRLPDTLSSPLVRLVCEFAFASPLIPCRHAGGAQRAARRRVPLSDGDVQRRGAAVRAQRHGAGSPYSEGLVG